MSINNWNSLPKDILLQICEYSSVIDCLNLTEVCKNFRELKDHPTFVKNLSERLFTNQKIPENFIKACFIAKTMFSFLNSGKQLSLREINFDFNKTNPLKNEYSLLVPLAMTEGKIFTVMARINYAIIPIGLI